jgi:hypothetical protein
VLCQSVHTARKLGPVRRISATVAITLRSSPRSAALDIIDGGHKDEPTDSCRQDAPPTAKDGRPWAGNQDRPESLMRLPGPRATGTSAGLTRW